MKESTLPVHSFSTWHFDCYADSKTFVVDASELSGSRNFWRRLYPDACDVGFRLVSEKTGRETVWYLNDVVYNGEEYGYWEALPTPQSVLENPGLSGWKMVIYND